MSSCRRQSIDIDIGVPALHTWDVKLVVPALLLSFILLLTSACASSGILRDQDYQASLALARQGELSEALREFPRKEDGGFITGVEKSWLGFWTGQADAKAAVRLRNDLEDRKVTWVSRETQTFFVLETEEGYLPAEHEVVAYHIISAMNFLRTGDVVSARVEAKRAAEVLQGDFNPGTSEFDDPALRIWLASVWLALGEWGSAQVDLRRAAAMNGDKDLKLLAEKDRAPSVFELRMIGSGPELVWTKSDPVPDFRIGGRAPEGLEHPVPTQAWYDHHRERNTALRDFVVKSNYMTQATGIKARSATQVTAGGVAAGTLMTAGTIVGVGLIGGALYLLVQVGGQCDASCGEALLYIGLLGAGIIKSAAQSAENLFTQVRKNTEADERRSFERLRVYRFVRFLPNWFGWSTSPRPAAATGSSWSFSSPDGTKVSWVWESHRDSRSSTVED